MKRRLLVGTILIILVAGLIGVILAGFARPGVAGAQDEGSGRRMVIAIEKVVNGERTAGEVAISFTDPPALPDREADVDGLFLSRGGDTLFVGTGAITVDVEQNVVNDQEPETAVNASHDGAEIPVVVTGATVVYEDTTGHPDITADDINAGEMTIARQLEPGDLDAIDGSTLIRAWGTMENGQLVAGVLVYEPIR